MTSWRFVIRSLVYHWRTNVAIALGVIAATAVLTGALIVGDSVRGSLHDLALDRLGHIDEVLLADRFFRADLAQEVAASPGFQQRFSAAHVAILLPSATAERSDSSTARAGQVFVVGCQEQFWSLATGRGSTERQPHPKGDEVILNEPLARELKVTKGDRVTLRFADASQVPADSTLGQKNNRVRSLPQLRVIAIVPATGLGRFRLQSNQNLPKNAYLSLDTVQQALDEPQRANAILVAGKHRIPAAGDHSALQQMLRPNLADLGLTIARVRETLPTETLPTDNNDPQAKAIFDYYTLTTDRMVLQPEMVTAAERAFGQEVGAQPLLTYLADSIAKPSPDIEATRKTDGIPYSIITAIDSSAAFPLLRPGRVLGPKEIVLNSWAAAQLKVYPGDEVVVHYFQPETIHGEHVLSSAKFTLREIVPLTEPAKPYDGNRRAVYEQSPTIFNDPDLTPVVKGITDQDSIERWEAPFPFDIRRKKPADDDYWENHRTTPKAFVSLEAGQELWGSRFGKVTSFRIPATTGLSSETIEQRLVDELRRPETLRGLAFGFSSVKQEALDSARGTTPFSALFLGLSFFIIIAAVLLVALMFRLGVEQRASQIGILGAVGLSGSKTTRLLLAEGALLAGIASLLGVVVGVGYAALMIMGLKTWWVGAIASPFLTFHMSPWSAVIGYVCGALVSLVAIYLSVRRLRAVSVRNLLAGHATRMADFKRRRGRVAGFVGLSLLIIAVALGAFAITLEGEAQAGAFVGGGALVLTGILMMVWSRLQPAARGLPATALWRLATTSATRNPTRSVLTIGLMAFATFLIVSMSAFRLQPTLEGSGGFSLIANSSSPVFANLASASARQDLMGSKASELQNVPIFGFRVKPGDDASCRNLYRATRPQVFGVTRAFAEHFNDPSHTRFKWARFKWDGASKVPDAKTNPWLALWSDTDDQTIPVVLDNNTRQYSLHWGGIGSVNSVKFEDGVEVKFRVAGLLSNSVLQGSLLISEEHFQRLFPGISGYRYFMIGAPADRVQVASDLLEDALGDQGFDVVRSEQVLTDLLAVQNTYLSTFQSLGALGLLLGTFGLATVQMRSILERRGELALLRAEGFRRRRVTTLVMLENTTLLVAGLAAGVIAAWCAVLPHIVFSGARVPLLGTLEMLIIVLVVGSLAGAWAVRTSMRGTVLESLRGE